LNEHLFDFTLEKKKQVVLITFCWIFSQLLIDEPDIPSNKKVPIESQL